MEYDPAVSTHKASSITSTTSTSSNSTWDHPISTSHYFPQDTNSLKPDDDHNKFDEYHPFDASLVSERISIPSTINYFTEEENDEKRKTFSNFIDTFITDNVPVHEMPNLVSSTNIKKENHEKITDSHPFNNNVTQPIYLQHGDQITVPSISMVNYNNRKSSNNCFENTTVAFHPRPIRPSPTQHHSRQRSDSMCSNTSKRSKLNRDLLTDDEKRVNHIASEQKRRNTIRMGFKDLTDIIPTLKNINNSKSTILFKAVEYIKHLDKRNRGLGEKISQLQVRMKVEGRMAEQQSSTRFRSSSSSAALNSQRYNKVFGNHTQKQQQQQQQQLNNDFSHLPAHTVSALLAHKNQQRQLEELQEQLRMQQLLLVKHNIVSAGSTLQQQEERPSTTTNQHRNSLTTTTTNEHQYNSISIPSSTSSHHSEENDHTTFQHTPTASFIVPQDLDEQRRQSVVVHHHTSITTKRRPWHH